MALMRLPGLGTRRRAERRVPDGHTEPVVAVALAYTPARRARRGSNPQSDGNGFGCLAFPVIPGGAAASRDRFAAMHPLPATARCSGARSGVCLYRGQRPLLRQPAGSGTAGGRSGCQPRSLCGDAPAACHRPLFRGLLGRPSLSRSATAPTPACGTNKNPGGERRPGFLSDPEGDRRTPSNRWEGRQVIGDPSLCRARICPGHTRNARALRRADLCLVCG
jgi:hypothetical protein